MNSKRAFQRVKSISTGGSILIVALWVLLIFTVIALSLGMRSAFEAKIARAFHDRFVDRSLARSGIDLAMFVLENDRDVRVDSQNDTWYNETTLKAALNTDVFDRLDILISDEESRININSAPRKILEALIEHIEKNKYVFTADPDTAIANILFARGDGSLAGDSTLDKDYAGHPFGDIEELSFLRIVERADLEVLKDFVTVFPGQGDELKVNINTADVDILNILISATVSDETTCTEFADAIAAFRATNDDTGQSLYFTKNDLSAYEFLDRLGLPRDVKLISLAVQFLRNATVDSQYFSVTAQVPESDSIVKAVVGPPKEALRGVVINPSKASSLTVLQWREV